MNEELLDPRVFYEKVRELTAAPPKQKGSAGWTEWFARSMKQLAADGGMYCQNYLSSEFGESTEKEWMNVDHVFVDSRKGYDRFPQIVVEHENGGFGTTLDEMETGELADPAKARASIEWAFWKCLSMRAKLSVLVAYPWGRNQDDRDFAMNVLGQIASGWVRSFSTEGLNCLVLLGWWKNGGPARPLDDLYEPFVVERAAALRTLERR